MYEQHTDWCLYTGIKLRKCFQCSTQKVTLVCYPYLWPLPACGRSVGCSSHEATNDMGTIKYGLCLTVVCRANRGDVTQLCQTLLRGEKNGCKVGTDMSECNLWTGGGENKTVRNRENWWHMSRWREEAGATQRWGRLSGRDGSIG